MTDADEVPKASLNPGALSPVEIIRIARKAVPAVDFALGVAGVAAAAAVVIAFVGSGRAAFIILGSIFVAMLLLFGFARLTASKSQSATNAGIVLLWAVIVFFCIFLVFTVTAVAIEWPPLWREILFGSKSAQDQIAPPQSERAPPSRQQATWSLNNCRTEADEALRSFQNDHSNTVRTRTLIDCKNPVAYYILGGEAFYRRSYGEAEKYFDWAVKSLPADEDAIITTSWKDNLASAWIETGKYSEAVNAYQKIMEVAPSDESRWDLGKAYLYDGQNDPKNYQLAISTLRGVDRNFAGKTSPGRVQILLAAAYAGQSTRTDISNDERHSAIRAGRNELCNGIKKNEVFWRSVLKETTPYPNASFKEEIRLLNTLGGGNVLCPPQSN
jgi:hypothetical protein